MAGLMAFSKEQLIALLLELGDECDEIYEEVQRECDIYHQKYLETKEENKELRASLGVRRSQRLEAKPKVSYTV